MNSSRKRQQKFYVILIISSITLLSVVICNNLQIANAVQDDQNQTRPWIGIQSLNITKEIANELNIGEPKGVLVTEVSLDSSAENLVLFGDIILKADNITITNKDKLESVVRDKEVGDSLKLTILRDTQEQVVNIIVGSRPDLKYISSLEYTDPNNVNFSYYEDLQLGIQLNYPSNWENEPTQFGPVTFRSMPEDINDITREYLKLYVYPVLNNTLEEEISIKAPLQNLTIIQPTHNTSLAGNPALMLEYSFKDDRRGMVKAMKIATQQNDNVYLLTYFAQESKYNNYLPTIQSMLNSFKIFEILPYVNFDLEIGVDYPSHWNKNINERSLILSPPARENVGDDFTTRLEIYSFKPYKNTPIDEAVKETLHTYNGSILSQNKFQLIGSNPTDWIKMKPSHMLNYSYIDSTNQIINNTEIITIKNGKEYHIIFSAKEKDYLSYLDTIHTLIRSFNIFSTLPYDKQFDKYSAITLRYPNTYLWKPQDIDNQSIQMSSFNNFTISVSHTNKSLPKITEELIGDHKQKKLTSLENSNTAINTNLGNNIPANKITFSYYNPDIGEQINEMHTYAIFKDKLYMLSFSEPKYYYDIDIATVEAIIDSFKITEQIQYNDNDFKHMQYGLIKNITYPSSTWNISNQDLTLFIKAPPENNTTIDKYDETLIVTVGAAGDRTLGELVGTDINAFKRTYANFSVIESQATTLLNNPAHKILYKYKENVYCKCDIKESIIYTIINNKYFAITYSAEFDKFFTYLPTIEKIIDSIEIEQGVPLDKKKSFGLPMNGSPVDLAINYVTNKTYIAVPDARVLQVIDGNTDNIIENITIGAYPNSVAVNTITNKIYVASPETDFVYVIDGVTNKIVNQIKAGPLLGDIAIDTNEFGGFSSLIFVANQGSNTTSVIDDVQGKILENIPTTINPYGIGIDSVQNKAFITSGINSVDVISYSTDIIGRQFNASLIDTIDSVGLFPTAIIVNPDTSRAYITNSGTNTVSIIDTVSNKLLGNITVGLFPNSLAFAPTNKKIFVGNTGNNTVSVIDTTIDDLKETHEIKVDSIPYDISVNPLNNMIYLANYDSKTISTINGTTEKQVSALTFNISPPDAGSIVCNNETKPKPVNVYIRIDSDSQCKAIAKKGYVFDKWTYDSSMSSNFTITNGTLFDSFLLLKNLIFNSTDDYYFKSSNLSDFKYGMPYTANFISLSNILQAGSPYISIGGLLMVILIAMVKPALNKKIIISRKSKLKNNKSIAPKEDDKKGILEKNEIITIDATVIIGVLIFLSLTEGFEENEQYQITVITASIVFPFAISAIIAVTKNKEFATRLMLAGFINLMISVILISIMRL